ncbi:MAG: DUF4189 domain-containing protein [Rhodospirillaceae bacterium]|nr:DUF4189 domain-containing protein [Rhodospirillaceae bacterium]
MTRTGGRAMLRSVRSVCVVAVFALVAASPAAAQGIYAALAISTSTGAFGYGFNYDSQASAETRAMAECRKHAQDCRVYARFYRNCMSLARGANNAFGWAIGYPADERPERALNACAAQRGTACRVVATFCSGTS